MTESTKRKQPTGGGRKGGTLFPKIDLKKAVEYNKKIVSKTHTSPQPDSTILPGVFNSNGPEGKVRASALRQFGLLNEDNAKMEATELGKNIASSPQEELKGDLQKACLSPKLFKKLFETFKGDTVNEPKLRQQAIKLKVHPDSSENCIKIFIASLVFAELAEKQGDNFVIKNIGVEVNSVEGGTENDDAIEQGDNENESPEENNKGKKENRNLTGKHKSASGVQVNINLDSTMDTEKLEKLLKVLKNYGAI